MFYAVYTSFLLFQLGISTLAPILSDRVRYPRYYRINPPDKKLSTARIELLKFFKWKKVSTIHKASENFYEVIIIENV